MPMPKRKPNYNGATTMQELLIAVCDYYGDHVDDRETEDPDHQAGEYKLSMQRAKL